jgi:hypothetical protein
MKTEKDDLIWINNDINQAVYIIKIKTKKIIKREHKTPFVIKTKKIDPEKVEKSVFDEILKELDENDCGFYIGKLKILNIGCGSLDRVKSFHSTKKKI